MGTGPVAGIPAPTSADRRCARLEGAGRLCPEDVVAHLRDARRTGGSGKPAVLIAGISPWPPIVLVRAGWHMLLL
jgi:hypothetical protein